MNKPLEYGQVMIILAILAVITVCALQAAMHVRDNAVEINQMPATKVKCDDSAVKGWCAGKHMTVKQWEGMQK